MEVILNNSKESRLVKRAIKKYKWDILKVWTLKILFLITSLSSMYISGLYINVLVTGVNWNLILKYMLVLAGLIIWEIMFNYWNVMRYYQTQANLVFYINYYVLKHIKRIRLSFFDDKDPAYLNQRVNEDINSIVNYKLDLICNMSISVLSFITIIIKYIVSQYILKDVDRELPGYWWLLTFMPVCCIGIIYFIYYLVEKRPENGVVFGAMLSSCLFLPLNLGIFKIYDLLSREFLLKQQNVIYEQNIRLFSEEMRMKEESLISRNIIHDYRKHFLVIQGMAYGEQCEEIVQYLDKLNIYYEKEKSLVNCGNFVIDAMMNSKYLIACKENIKHEDRIVVPEAMNFEDVDLCILLGNMLDNAYEATKKAEKKIINTSIIYSKGKLTIGVKNTYDGIIKKDRKGNYISTKMNKTNHGMGIKLMQRIVDKYNGFLSLENDDNYFVVIAVLIEKIM